MKKHRLLKQDYSGASKVYGRLTKGFLEVDMVIITISRIKIRNILN